MEKKFLLIKLLFLLIFVNSSFSMEIKIIGGSTSIKTVLEPIKPAFEKETGIKLTLIPAGSKKALIELDNGNCDAASTAHNLNEILKELEKENVTLKNKNILKTHKLYHKTNYVVIVNEKNSVQKLTKEQLKAIFLGKITNWKEVGGSDLPIDVIWGKLAPGTKNEIKKQILDNQNPIESKKEAATDLSIINIVATDPKAIGVVAKSSIAEQNIKIVNTPEITSEPIILITAGEPSKAVKLLIDFIDKEGKKYIK